MIDDAVLVINIWLVRACSGRECMIAWFGFGEPSEIEVGGHAHSLFLTPKSLHVFC